MKKQYYTIVNIHPFDTTLYEYRFSLLERVGWIDEDDRIKDAYIDGYESCRFHFVKPIRLGVIPDVDTVIFLAVKLIPI
jgi:hypothetical protein